MRYKAFTTSVAAIGLVLSAFAHSATGNITTTVKRTLVDSEQFGGCMINIGAKPAGLNCGGTNWVTASCVGEYNTPSMGWRKFESAQIAQATGATVRVFLDDTRKHNFKCFITGIEVIQ